MTLKETLSDAQSDLTGPHKPPEFLMFSWAMYWKSGPLASATTRKWLVATIKEVRTVCGTQLRKLAVYLTGRPRILVTGRNRQGNRQGNRLVTGW